VAGCGYDQIGSSGDLARAVKVCGPAAVMWRLAASATVHPPPTKSRLDNMVRLLWSAANFSDQFHEEIQIGAAGHQLSANQDSRSAVELECMRFGVVAREE
jgi:hypothetical protein